MPRCHTPGASSVAASISVSHFVLRTPTCPGTTTRTGAPGATEEGREADQRHGKTRCVSLSRILDDGLAACVSMSLASSV
eukprot:scaffold18898_cov29-Tisochrysis_lutea.AAC.2